MGRRCWAWLLVATVSVPLGAQQRSSHEELQRFAAVLAHINGNYADSVSYRSLLRAAIDGMMRSLDPHSWFLPSEDAERLNAVERGDLAVTGTEVDLVDGVATVRDVRDDSPADRAGLRPGDRLVAIDAVPVAGLSAQSVALALAGEKGSKVRIAFERGPALEPDSLTVTVKRDVAKPDPSVRLARMVDDSTGVVVLGAFGERSSDELRKAIRSLRGDGMRRLVLDLRGNPGGIVTEAVEIASRFLEKDALVFRTTGRVRTADAEYRTTRAGEFRELPMVVLIDERSASAAEALAASLQDHDRALVAGRRSFGKALMQTGFLVPDGFVQLTIGHVVSPSGRVIQRPYRGLAIEQYRAFAGDSTWQDTTAVFRTAAGREVYGGGGVAPDVTLPGPPAVPRWFSVAADSGWDRAIADSVAYLLDPSPAGRVLWESNTAAWRVRLAEPLLARIRGRLDVAAAADPALLAAIARRLARRAAEVRWDLASAEALALRSDPDVRAATGLFGRLR